MTDEPNYLSVADLKAEIAKIHDREAIPAWKIAADAELVSMVSDGLVVAWINEAGDITMSLTEAGIRWVEENP